MTKVIERGRQVRVLLIEDNPGDAVLTQRAFRRASMLSEITVAETGEAGLRLLRQEGEHADTPRPDIILLDLNLPHMSGHEVLREIKSTPILRRIPVIILSSSSTDCDIANSYDHYANGYIAKPLTNDTYDDIVSKVEQYWFTLMQLPPDNPHV